MLEKIIVGGLTLLFCIFLVPVFVIVMFGKIFNSLTENKFMLMCAVLAFVVIAVAINIIAFYP